MIMGTRIADDWLEQRVMAFVAIHSGVDRRKLTPVTRLAQDIDIKGDDASKFFDAFGKEFRVNLDELNMHWDRHFHPEAGMLLNGLVLTIGCLAFAGFLLFVFYMPYRRFFSWAASGFASLVSFFTVWYRSRISVPVTIADLVDAADTGRWVKPYTRA